MEKKYTYHTATNHRKLDVLQTIVGKRQHAVILDQFLFWSINSTFKLPKSNKQENWFCYAYEDMAHRLHISESTLYRIVKKFVDLGLIERIKKKLMGDTRTCFRATQKLIDVGLDLTAKSIEKEDNQGCSKIKQKESCTAGKKTVGYIKEYNYTKNVNNISIKNESQKKPKIYSEKFAVIGKKLISEQKEYIAKTIENLKTQHKLKLSISSDELYLQLIYAVENLRLVPTAKTLKHRVNIFAKIIREGKWCSPMGFYKNKNQKETYQNQRQSNQLANRLQAKKSALLNQLSLIKGELKQLPMLLKTNPLELNKQFSKVKKHEQEILLELKKVRSNKMQLI